MHLLRSECHRQFWRAYCMNVIRIGFVVIVTAAGYIHSADFRQPPKGIWITDNTHNSVKTNGIPFDLFDYGCDGVLEYAAWRKIETEEGKFSFYGFEKVMSNAVQKNKSMAYHIMAGEHAPDWVFQKKGVRPYHVTTNVQSRRTYLPYSFTPNGRTLNNDFLTVWRQTIKSFSRYLHTHPQWSRLGYVMMTGWPDQNGLEIQWHFDTYAEYAATYDQSLYIEFCKRIVDIFIEEFPDIPLGICFVDVFGRTKSGDHQRRLVESSEIVRYALSRAAAAKASVVPMGLWMAWPSICTNAEHPLRKSMSLFRSEFPGIAVALEGPMGTHSDKRYAPLSMQLEFASSFGAQWVQLWHHDITRSSNAEVIAEYRKRIGRTNFRND